MVVFGPAYHAPLRDANDLHVIADRRVDVVPSIFVMTLRIGMSELVCVFLLPVLGASHAAAQNLQTLYSFTQFPGVYNGPLLSSGGLLGVIPGGSTSAGLFYQLTAPEVEGGPWTQSVLYAFPEGFPNSGLVRGPYGTYFGTTASGGSSIPGAVYQLFPPSSAGGAWTSQIIHTFTDAECPWYGCLEDGPPAVDSKGSVYVSASGNLDCGSILKLTAPEPGGTEWTAATIFSFPDSGPGGCIPNAGLQIGSNGTIYGTTSSNNSAPFNEGVVFGISPTGTETVLHTFNPGVESTSDGYQPLGGLTIDSKGTLYGVTEYGGADERGTVFRISFSGNEPQYSILHAFTGPDGMWPLAPPVIGSAGQLYGTASIGGTSLKFDSYGTVYELTPPTTAGGTWPETTLFQFGAGPRGSHPAPQLAISPNGTVYGITVDGGANGFGTVFSIR
jgi:uncharacterized repeat protein (TIGR03803 family)